MEVKVKAKEDKWHAGTLYLIHLSTIIAQKQKWVGDAAARNYKKNSLKVKNTQMTQSWNLFFENYCTISNTKTVTIGNDH